MKIKLKKYIDEKYKCFSQKLIFTKYEILGIRSKYLQEYAKNLHKQSKFFEFFENFLISDEKFYEYLQIIVYGINYEKDFQKALDYTDKYLDFIDNWANCDTLAPKSFKKQNIISFAKKQIKSNHTYRIRFGIICFMKFIPLKDGIKIVFDIKSDEYYVNMARAWYFQAMFAKDFEATFDFLKSNQLDKTTLKMTLQKCKDSLKISKENKVKIIQLMC